MNRPKDSLSLIILMLANIKHTRPWSRMRERAVSLRIPPSLSLSLLPTRLHAFSSTSSSSSGQETEGSFDRLINLQRSLEAAISTETYERAASIRDEMKVLLESIGAVEGFWWSQVKLIRDTNTSLEDKLKAISSLGATGSASIIPLLASLLHEPSLQEAAQTSCWTIWMRPNNKDTIAGDAMKEGCRLMMTESTHNDALVQFNICIQRCPDWCEAYNKRATLFYLMRRWKESVEDCQFTLELCPQHFGAASGMGLCLMNINDKAKALTAFELAIGINPGLVEIRRIVEGLRIEVRSNLQSTFESGDRSN